MTIEQYIDTINQRYILGNATEHSYRGDLQNLLESLIPDIKATNEPQRQSCGAPDYIITKKNIPIGFIEAKNIGCKDLEGKKKSINKDQFDRYKASLNNIIFTDYLNFYLYYNEDFITKVSIGYVTIEGIKPKVENFKLFEDLIKDFCTYIGQTIKQPKKLAKMMAGKARLLADVIEKALNSDEINQNNSTLQDQMMAFKNILIHDITPKGFADVYAQTIAYGMFAARFHDSNLESFSRQKASELIPKSNPFLRKLFGYIAGPNIDDRIKWIVDNLAEIFLAANVEEILRNYGKKLRMEDPIIHFYETFLAEYDPKLRTSKGVWYTPSPIVNFIVRAVDDILKNDFKLNDGLADTSKIIIKDTTQTKDKRFKKGLKNIEKEVHKVQILDPATGTGTFLAEIIKHINKLFKGQEGIWSSYVENHLIPRLNGFELLMASYAMAHLQLDLLLRKTGFKSTKIQRTKVYLTNSLEEYHPDTGTLFANWLSNEANEANFIKRDTPVMCIIGNPPYAISSTNKGEWIQKLLLDYKKNLNERKINIDDDYIKFIRYGQYFIEKNGEGILAYITSNSFLDGITHRQMRKKLLETFNSIYIIDLHGNLKKKEVTPEGKVDQNVFNIMTGVSINIFIKTSNSKKHSNVFHTDVYGLKDDKYNYLSKNSINTIKWKEVKYKPPYYFFTPKNFTYENEYQKGFKINELFINYNTGIQTKRDALCLQKNKNQLLQIKNDFLNYSDDDLRKKYNLVKDNRDWKISYAREDLKNNEPQIIEITHRPFDNKWTFYTGKSKGFLGYPRNKTMKHMLYNDNYALLSGRQNKSATIDSFFITKLMSEMKCAERTIQSYHFPLYVYSEQSQNKNLTKVIREPNLEPGIIKKISRDLDLIFVNEKQNDKKSFSPVDILDYIYAILNSKNYRDKFSAFLKIDFPRIKYPKNKKMFWDLVTLGKEIRITHLFESNKLQDLVTTYPIDGDNIINTKIGKKDWEIIDNENFIGRIWINEEQFFSDIPLEVWEFYIGGYQPAQKWLKDRKGKYLDYQDIIHYQQIIVAISETIRIMNEIDKILI